MAKDTRKVRVTKCPTHSDFFDRFNLGLHKRMGDIIRPDRAISHDIMRELMCLLDDEWLQVDQQKRLRLALEATFYILAFTLALRGEEVPLIELRGIISHWERGISHSKPHVVVTLLGRFKNEIGESYHLMPVLATTPRGLQPGKWVERVIKEYQERGVTSGYMFRNEDGTKLKPKTMGDKFYDRLEYIKTKRPDLISSDVEVSEEYGISRSFRRGGTSEATNKGAPPAVIELNGRWRKSNQSGASKPNVCIREHYIDVRLVLDQLLEFSRHL